MFDILLPEDQIQMPVLDMAVVGGIVAEGVKAGNIINLHSCVEYVNDRIEPNIGGNDVQGIFGQVVDEARRMSALADQGITEDGVFFTYADIEAFKIEQYGSLEAWQASLQEMV